MTIATPPEKIHPPPSFPVKPPPHFLKLEAQPPAETGVHTMRYLRASQRSYLVLSENAMDCWILS